MHYISPYKNTILGACTGHLHFTTAHTRPKPKINTEDIKSNMLI